MVTEKDIQDIKRRAGIFENQTTDMARLEQQIADNYINGNLSDVKNILHNLDSTMAAAMALRVFLYLNDVDSKHATNFAMMMINAARHG